MNNTNVLTDKITFIFNDSESGVRDFVKFLIDSGILDINVKFANRENVELGDIKVGDYEVIVSYWIDTMGVSVQESIELGNEFLNSINQKPRNIYYQNLSWDKWECKDYETPIFKG